MSKWEEKIKNAGMRWSDGNQAEPTQLFIDQIKEVLSQGYGFVPFIGAGFSAPSGAPLTYEVEDYLQRCICISLGIDEKCIDDRNIEPWNPRTDHWPPFIDRDRVYDRGYWTTLLFEKIEALREWERKQKKNNFTQEEKGSEPAWHKSLPLLYEGFGAMQDWRTALLFLSRLNRGRRGSQDAGEVHLGVPQQEVIDACFREVLKGKYPTLGHRMLAALAGALRLDILLTTNFDNLLERGFEAARNPLEVFEVHIDGKLPDWSTVSDVRALVKLHGGRSSLRADYSLDEAASEEDKRAFLHYLLSAKGREDFAKGKTENLDIQNHLLVIGFSATDQRIRGFIEYASKRLAKNFRVYWICYALRDVEAITKFMTEKAPNSALKQQSTIIRHTQPGLFLLQLYQSLRKTLPPLGSIFPSVSRLAFPPLEPNWITKELALRNQQVRAYIDKMKQTLFNFEAETWRTPKVILATSNPEVSGITSVSARAFHELEMEGRVCLWIDMNDISSADNLFEVLLETIYYRLGFEDWIPSMVGETRSRTEPFKVDRREREIDRLVRSVNKRWIVFLNAFETPGANASDGQEPEGNGWLDRYNLDDNNGVSESDRELKNSHFLDRSRFAAPFIGLLHTLTGPGSRMSVVLMTRDRNFFARGLNETRIAPELIELQEQTYPVKTFFREKMIAGKAMRWVGTDPAKRNFLYALVLMQRPRHLATLWSSALAFDRSKPDLYLNWIQKLEDIGLIRRKYGGLIWMHSPCRQMLRQKLQGSDDPKFAKESHIHQGIAEWYQQILEASEAPGAVFEAADHHCRASLAFLDAPQPSYALAEGSVAAAAALLKSNSFLIQTHGYSRGSCRRLEDIADRGTKIALKVAALRDSPSSGDHTLDVREEETLSPQKKVILSIYRLWIVCAEIMRAVAREVGEDSKAYYRHRQVGRLMSGESDLKNNPSDLISDKSRGRTPVDWKDVQSDDIDFKITEALKHKQPDVENNGPSSEWLRWRRWCCMLAVASRSYSKVNSIIEADLVSMPKQILKTQPQRIEFLRLIEQSVELHLHEVSALFRIADMNGNKNPDDIRQTFSRTSEMIDRGLKLARKIRSEDRSTDSRDVILANWCEVRLRLHQSVIECRNRNQGVPPLSVLEAMGILSNAEANLRVSDVRRSRSELALVDLHRAEVKLYEAGFAVINSAGKPVVLLSKLVTHLETRLASMDENVTGGQVFCTLQRDFGDVGKLRQAGALVTDSLRFLTRAEPVLRDRRRNVLWTTWFFERKLRAIALSIAVSIFDSGTPIPFLGLEAAMRLTETEADRLLTDTVRMVRVDSYRLASVIDAYMSCISALNLRLQMDAFVDSPDLVSSSKGLALPRRRERMLVNLRQAKYDLLEVIDRREKHFGFDDKSNLDQNVSEYVDTIHKKVESLLAQRSSEIVLKAFDAKTIITILQARIKQSDASLSGEQAFTRAKDNPKEEQERCGITSDQISLMTRLPQERIEIIERELETKQLTLATWEEFEWG